MALSSRFVVDTTTVLAGAFLAVASLTFAPLAGAWTGFGVFIGLAVIGGAGLALDRHLDGRILHGLLTAVAIWSLIAAVVFTAGTAAWLVFAGAVAVVALSVADLAAHEVTTERVVHQLEVTPAGAVEERIAA
jgi:hypothetical protein